MRKKIISVDKEYEQDVHEIGTALRKIYKDSHTIYEEVKMALESQRIIYDETVLDVSEGLPEGQAHWYLA